MNLGELHYAQVFANILSPSTHTVYTIESTASIVLGDRAVRRRINRGASGQTYPATSKGREFQCGGLTWSNDDQVGDLYAAVLTQLAHHTWLQIGADEAKPLIEQALAVARSQGNPQTLANALMVFGLVLISDENFAAAQSTLEESMTLFQELRDKWGYALAVMSLSNATFRKADLATALALNERALTVFRELGDTYFQSVCLWASGRLHAKLGDWKVGLGEVRESLTLSGRLDSKYEVAAGLLRLAEAEQDLEHPARAVRLYWAARSVYDSIGAWHQGDDRNLEKRLASCRAALSDAAFTEAVEGGSAMTMDQAIEYALESSINS